MLVSEIGRFGHNAYFECGIPDSHCICSNSLAPHDLIYIAFPLSC